MQNNKLKGNLNEVLGYNIYYHTKSYMAIKRSEKRIRERELMTLLDYDDIDDFRYDRELWNNLSKKIPKKYLDIYNIDINVLRFTVELDIEEFDNALNGELEIKYILVRHNDATYTSIPLPKGLKERKAIEIAKQISKENNHKCYITFKDLKITYIDPSGEDYTEYYRPDIKIDDDYIYFARYKQNEELKVI